MFKVEKLKDNRPQTLAGFLNARPTVRAWFVFIHKDESARKYYGKHWREVVGTFDTETKQDQGGNLAPYLFNTANKYTNRKHCAEVYAITTPKAPEEEKRQKQTERHNSKAPANYWRYKNIKITLI